MRKTILGVLTAFVSLALLGGLGADPIWHLLPYNVLVKHQLRVDGAAEFNAAVTDNTTRTSNGPLVVTGENTILEIPFTAGSTTKTVTGSFGDANYYLLFEPTANVSPQNVANRTATSFDVSYQCTEDTTVRAELKHYE